jgi:hypothetical protein
VEEILVQQGPGRALLSRVGTEILHFQHHREDVHILEPAAIPADLDEGAIHLLALPERFVPGESLSDRILVYHCDTCLLQR